MDFRLASEKLENGEVTQEEVIEQILNLPCMYGIFKDKSQIFCLEVFNEQQNENIEMVLFYSNLELAIRAIDEYEIPSNWYIAQWVDIEEAFQTALSLKVNAVAFDSLPDFYNLNGLIVDTESIHELLSISST